VDAPSAMQPARLIAPPTLAASTVTRARFAA
jgi:hypothetical protein